MSNRLIRPNEQVGTHTDFLRMRLIRFAQSRIQRWGVVNLLSPFWRLYCNLEDGAAVLVDGRRFPLRPRRVYLVPAWMRWSGVSAGPMPRHIYAFFDLPGMTYSLTRAAFPLPLQVYPRPRSRGDDRAAIDLGAQFEALGAAVKSEPTPDPYLVCWAKALTYLGLREAFAQVAPEIRARCLQPGTGTHPLVRVLNLIDTSLHDDLSNDVLAETVPCSRAHLVRLFRSLLGVSPARYITERRVSRAAELLVYGDESLEQIADACGFPNRHYFTRVFTQVLGTPPAQYRKMGLAGRGR